MNWCISVFLVGFILLQVNRMEIRDSVLMIFLKSSWALKSGECQSFCLTFILLYPCKAGKQRIGEF